MAAKREAGSSTTPLPLELRKRGLAPLRMRGLGPQRRGCGSSEPLVLSFPSGGGLGAAGSCAGELGAADAARDPGNDQG